MTENTATNIPDPELFFLEWSYRSKTAIGRPQKCSSFWNFSKQSSKQREPYTQLVGCWPWHQNIMNLTRSSELVVVLIKNWFQPSVIHPIVLDPHHTVTKLLIKDYDNKLCHPGESICKNERKWKPSIGSNIYAKNITSARSNPSFRRWQIYRQADWDFRKHLSNGMDCFGPFESKLQLLWEKMGDNL